VAQANSLTIERLRALKTSIVVCVALAALVAGCGPNYSPDTYASNAVQQANKVDPGVIVGVREVGVSASGATGTVAGAAAGGIAGAQVGSGVGSAFGALGGSLVGGLAGNAAEHLAGDTKAFEYIIRKPNGDLLSVTQRDTQPLTVGQKVLVIAGNQARVVPDYTVSQDAANKDKPPETAKDTAALNGQTTTAPQHAAVSAVPLAPPDSTPASPPVPQVENGP
jgi:outer membrane lipoprotein SlyB